MLKQTLIEKINKSEWWHVPPRDKNAYKKRGKFLASTFHQAEFYGRPNDEPESVEISNPIFGFSELEILMKLFSANIARTLLNNLPDVGGAGGWYKERIALDAKMYKQAKCKGFDAIVLIAPSGKHSLLNNRKPNSIELNLL
ncbi:MAG: hypothetical protein C4562_01620 [Actinobacteria bacterium]|nr:MAG: hypothetical protein C4562_01620 [Actinomycetota bacterium]